MPKKDKGQNLILEEIKRHNKVLMEHMEGQVKTVAEQHASVIEKIEEIKSDVGVLKNDMAIVKPAVEKHSQDLKEIKSELGNMKSDIGNMKSDIGNMKSELDTVKTAVMENSREIKDLKAGQQRIEQKFDTTLTNHEQRIKKVEEKVEI